MPAGIAAARGNVTHKGLELIANRKLAEQDGLMAICDESGALIPCDKISPEWAIQFGFDHYKKIEPWHPWQDSDFQLSRKFMYNHLNWNGGEFDPRNRKIVAVEKHFDLTIDKPWATYYYKLPDGTEVMGQLAVKGTIDLTTEVDSDTYEIIDIKTGKTTVFPTGEEKTLEYVSQKDEQFLMYYWAARQLYPNIKNWIFSVFYSQFNVPFTFCYTDADVERAELMLRSKFERIKNNKRPKKHRGYWCKYVCHAGKTMIGDKTMCEHYSDEVARKSLDQVFVELGGLDKIRQYGSGGGRHAKG